MFFHLYRNQRIELDGSPVKMIFKWTSKENSTVDICLSAFMTNSESELPSKYFFVFFGNTESPDLSVLREDKSFESQDALMINPAQISSGISQIHMVVASRKDKDFGQVKDAIFEIKDTASGKTIASHFFYGTFISETAIELGTFIRENDKWYFYFSGKRYRNDLLFFLVKFYPRTLT